MNSLSQSFSDLYRLRSTNQVYGMRRLGKKLVCGPLVVYFLQNHLNHPRLAVAVSKRAGQAVNRNWMKRKTREFFRKNKGLLKSFDYFFYWSKGWLKSQDIDLFFKQVAGKIHG